MRVGRIVSRLRGSAGETNAARVGEWVFPVLVLGGSAFVLTCSSSDAGATARTGARTAPRSFAWPSVWSRLSPLLNLAGFVAAGTVLFACTASAFGSRRWLRDALLGLTLCATVYVTFTLRTRRCPSRQGCFLPRR